MVFYQIIAERYLLLRDFLTLDHVKKTIAFHKSLNFKIPF